MFRIPATFSNKTKRGFVYVITRCISGQSQRSSASPRRSPATDTGWHGGPPVTKVTFVYPVPSNAFMSSKTGTSGQCFTRILRQYGSRSTKQIVFSFAQRQANANPPIPLNKSTWVTLPVFAHGFPLPLNKTTSQSPPPDRL